MAAPDTFFPFFLRVGGGGGTKKPHFHLINYLGMDSLDNVSVYHHHNNYIITLYTPNKISSHQGVKKNIW